MQAFDPVRFGERLRLELERHGWDVRTLQRHLVEVVGTGGRRGTSYGSVWTYVNGQAAEVGPRTEVVDAMATAFGVRSDYLRYGGPRTAAEAEAETEARQRNPLLDLMWRRVPALDELPYRFVVALIDYAGQRDQLERERHGPVQRTPKEYDNDLVRYVREAWKDIVRFAGFAGDLPALSTYAAHDYLDAAIHARSLALRVHYERAVAERKMARSVRTALNNPEGGIMNALPVTFERIKRPRRPWCSACGVQMNPSDPVGSLPIVGTDGEGLERMIGLPARGTFRMRIPGHPQAGLVIAPASRPDCAAAIVVCSRACADKIAGLSVGQLFLGKLENES